MYVWSACVYEITIEEVMELGEDGWERMGGHRNWRGEKEMWYKYSILTYEFLKFKINKVRISSYYL